MRTSEKERSAVVSHSPFIKQLVAEEIRRIVAEAFSGDRVLSAPEAAESIIAIYPGCNLAVEQVANEVMMAAAHAGVAVEIGRQTEQVSAQDEKSAFGAGGRAAACR